MARRGLHARLTRNRKLEGLLTADFEYYTMNKDNQIAVIK